LLYANITRASAKSQTGTYKIPSGIPLSIFDAIYEAPLHADPITSILYETIIEIYKRLKVMPIDRA